MKIAAMAIFIIFFVEQLHAGSTPSGKTKPPIVSSYEITFNAKSAKECTRSEDVENCLYAIFGKGIGYELVNGSELRSVRFPHLKGINLLINKTMFPSIHNPEIRFYPDVPGYTVCGTNHSVRLNNVFVKGRSGCICGFDPNGEFRRQLDQQFAFIPPKVKIEISEMRCPPGAFFDGNGIRLLEQANICGYQFLQGSEFSLGEGGFEFVAPKDGEIEGQVGTIKVIKGKSYMSNSSTKKPCLWEQVIESDPADEPR